jgi:hypothetical protein
VAIGRAMIAVFGLLTVVSLPSPASCQEPAAEHRTGEHHVPFIVRDGAVYVRARVNGNRAILLLDTGAVLTTFSLKMVPTQETGSRITINMAKGSVVAFRLAVGFTLGESTVRGEHCAFHQNAIVGDFKFGAADGVVGLDVLGSFKSVTFDFKESMLILEDR